MDGSGLLEGTKPKPFCLCLLRGLSLSSSELFGRCLRLEAGETPGDEGSRPAVAFVGESKCNVRLGDSPKERGDVLFGEEAPFVGEVKALCFA